MFWEVSEIILWNWDDCSFPVFWKISLFPKGIIEHDEKMFLKFNGAVFVVSVRHTASSRSRVISSCVEC